MTATELLEGMTNTSEQAIKVIGPPVITVALIGLLISLGVYIGSNQESNKRLEELVSRKADAELVAVRLASVEKSLELLALEIKELNKKLETKR